MKIFRANGILAVAVAMAVIVAGLLPTGAAGKPAGQPVKALDIQQTSSGVSISVGTADRTKIRHARLDSAHVIWMDLSDSVLPEVTRTESLESGPVSMVKLSQFTSNPPVVRLVAILRQAGAKYRVNRSQDGGRIVMEVLSPGAKAAPAPVVEKPKPVAVPVAKPIAKPVAAQPIEIQPLPRFPKGDGEALETVVSLDFRNTDVHDVFKAISKQSGINIIVSESAKGNVTVSLKNTTVEDALKMLARMTGLDFRKIDSSYLVGSPEEIRRTVAAQGVTEVYALKHLKGAEAQAMLEKAFPHLSVQGQTGNTVVITGDQVDVRKAFEIIGQVDVPDNSATPTQIPVGKTYKVCKLDYLNAAKAVDAIKKIFPDLSAAIGPEPFSPPAARLVPLSVSSGNGNGGGRSGGGSSGSYGGGTGSIFSGGTAQDLLKQDSQLPEGMRSETIILYGPTDLVDAAASMLKDMDVAPPQVMIEAKLVDISPEFNSDLGIEWSWGNPDEPKSGNITLTENKDSNISFGSFVRSPLVLNAKLNALIKDKKARMLANPRIAVIDNEEANIFIGDILRFQVLSENTTTGTLYTVEEYPVGVALLVRPRVNADGFITMKVHPVVSRLTGTINGLPQTGSRESDSTIRIKEGETVVIGGLLQDEDIQTMSKIPLLGDLPVLGDFFRNRSTSRRKSEVTIFLTPRIIRNGEE